MRLQNVESGHRLPHKLLLSVIGFTSRDKHQPYDILKMLFYRPEFFGKAFSELMHTVMRGPSVWTVGERELFAAFTSHLNACRY